VNHIASRILLVLTPFHCTDPRLSNERLSDTSCQESHEISPTDFQSSPPGPDPQLASLCLNSNTGAKNQAESSSAGA
jgi:hypothetical protein